MFFRRSNFLFLSIVKRLKYLERLIRNTKASNQSSENMLKRNNQTQCANRLTYEPSNHSTCVEWSNRRTTRRTSRGSIRTSGGQTIEPLDVRRVIEPTSHSMYVEWLNRRTTRCTSNCRTNEPLDLRPKFHPETLVWHETIRTTWIRVFSSNPRYDLLWTTAILPLTSSWSGLLSKFYDQNRDNLLKNRNKRDDSKDAPKRPKRV